MAAVELKDPLSDVVQKVTVVGHGDNGAGIFLEVTLQPSHRFSVQVVGRLVQQQHVGRRQQQAAQRDAAFFTAGELADDRLPRRQAQGIGRDLEFALELPAAGRIDGVLQFGLLFEQRVHLIVAHRLRKAIADRVKALDLTEGFTDAFHDCGAHGVVIIQLRLLRQIAHADAGLGTRFAVYAGIDAGHDLQQRRLARAVEAQHADLGAGEKRQADIPQDDALGRHHLGDAIHGVDVLGHTLELACLDVWGCAGEARRIIGQLPPAVAPPGPVASMLG